MLTAVITHKAQWLNELATSSPKYPLRQAVKAKHKLTLVVKEIGQDGRAAINLFRVKLMNPMQLCHY